MLFRSLLVDFSATSGYESPFRWVHAPWWTLTPARATPLHHPGPHCVGVSFTLACCLVLSVSFRLFSHFLCFVSEAHCEQCLSRLVLRRKEGKEADLGYGSSESDLGGKGEELRAVSPGHAERPLGLLAPFVAICVVMF